MFYTLYGNLPLLRCFLRFFIGNLPFYCDVLYTLWEPALTAMFLRLFIGNLPFYCDVLRTL